MPDRPAGRRASGHPKLTIALAAMAVLAMLLGAAVAEDEGPHQDEVALGAAGICAIIATEAGSRGLPPGFLARLIWQESRFDRFAISPKGAQGIAQFMPATARERALEDPFDIPSALAGSAAFLDDLLASFGNLGLAAAAYNAGPMRVRRWLAGEVGLPRETRHYVRVITGLTAEDWRQPDIEAPDFALDGDDPFDEACTRLASGIRLSPPAEAPPSHPWGAQVAAHFSRDIALSTYARLQRAYASVLAEREPMVVRHRAPARGNRALFAVRIGAETRQEADALCSALRAVDGPCMVFRN